MTTRFALVMMLGPRTMESAVAMLGKVAGCCGRKMPLLLMDAHLPYPAAILQVFGQVKHRRRRKGAGRGRLKHKKLKPPPGLLAGVVDKVRDATGNLLRVKTRALFGRLKDIRRRIKKFKLGVGINTAHVERFNGTMRGRLARLARKTRDVSRRSRFGHLASSGPATGERDHRDPWVGAQGCADVGPSWHDVDDARGQTGSGQECRGLQQR